MDDEHHSIHSTRTQTPEGVSTAFRAQTPAGTVKRKFRSYTLREPYEKPWLADPNFKKTRVNNWIVLAFVFLGCVGAALYIYFTIQPYIPQPECLIWEDNFETLDTDVWTHEVQLDGFGTGAFDWTTTDSKNSYVDAAGLHIVPTLTNETTTITADQMWANYTLNLTDCTGTTAANCMITSNPLNGSLIPPVRSARLVSRGKKFARYGRVEVVAKMPKGDWLWPAIWMMPEDSVYGEWPRSGEIDIMESRGNDNSYPVGGRDDYYGTLHWGPSSQNDGYWRTSASKKVRRTDYTEGFNTFGIEWDENQIYFYLKSRIYQTLFVGFSQKKTLWQLGNFAQTSENSTLLVNPWTTSNSTTGNAPFDQNFYLILNVAVGGKNGWFPDNMGDKPWLDAGANAQWTFWSAVDKWLPTWGAGDERGMTVRSVKMWSKGACT